MATIASRGIVVSATALDCNACARAGSWVGSTGAEHAKGTPEPAGSGAHDSSQIHVGFQLEKLRGIAIRSEPLYDARIANSASRRPRTGHPQPHQATIFVATAAASLNLP